MLLVVALSILAMALRLGQLYRTPNFDVDEDYQVGIMNGSYIEMWQLLQIHEHTSWLALDYPLVYPFYVISHGSRWGTAIPHVLATLLGLFYFYRICRMYLRSAGGFVAAYLIFAFNQPLIEYATNIRAYAVLPMLSMMCFYYMHPLFEKYSDLSRRDKFVLATFFILVLWFHFYGIIMLACCALWMLLKQACLPGQRKNIMAAVRFLALVTLFFMPFWLYCLFGPHLPREFAERGINTFDFIPNPLVSVVGFVKAILGNLTGNRILYILLPGVLFPFVFNYKDSRRQVVFFLIMVLLPLLILLDQALISKYWYLQRQFTWVIPFFAVFLGMSWGSAYEHVRGGVAGVFSLPKIPFFPPK